ncbi:MAG: DUF4920 domain-containing protein [Salinibacter sp.]
MSALARLYCLSALACIPLIVGACQSGSSPAGDPAVEAYGASVDTASARAAGAVAAEPSALEGTTVTVRGRISTVCQKKGCWLALETGTATPIRVLVPRTEDGYEFTVPTTLAGEATVTGTLQTAELDTTMQKHFAEDGAASAPAQEVQIAATGLRVVPDA